MAYEPTMRYYLVPTHGAGTMQDPRRSILHDQPAVGFDWSTDTFEEIENPDDLSKNLVCLWTTPAKHALVEALPGVVVLTRVFNDNSDMEDAFGKDFGQDVAAEAQLRGRLIAAGARANRQKPGATQGDMIANFINDLLSRQSGKEDFMHRGALPVQFGGKPDWRTENNPPVKSGFDPPV